MTSGDLITALTAIGGFWLGASIVVGIIYAVMFGKP